MRKLRLSTLMLLIVIAVLYAAAFGLQRRGGFSLGVRKLARS